MRSENFLAVDTLSMLSAESGTRQVTADDVESLAARLAGMLPRLTAWQSGAPYSFFTLPFVTDSRPITARAEALVKRFQRTVVFGIGGASLGGEMLATILGTGRHPVTFYDNIDPDTMAALDGFDWRDTLLLVISKSGNTAETLSQLLTTVPQLERTLGANWPEQVLVITENTHGALAGIARRYGIEIIAHPPVGGRYSVLSVVGLLPAALAGVDIAALLRGARNMAERCLNPNLADNPALRHAAIQYLHARQGRTLSVLMIYADRLRTLAHWYRQLWGESLGKRNAGGQSLGLTPITAYGVTDQHSQLQLYLEGPDDKQFTLVVDPTLQKRGAQVDPAFADLPGIGPLAGHSLGELFQAEFQATCTTLTRHGRPLRQLALDAANPAALGEMILMLELEAVAIAHLLEIDPFDQPAVEEGKILAREFLNR